MKKFLLSIFAVLFAFASVQAEDFTITFGKLLGERGDEMELFCQFKEDEVHFMKFFYENPNVL